MLKATDNTHPWVMLDDTRQATGNILEIYANTSAAENGGSGVTFTSTGFYISNNNSYTNQNGNNYIYMAFADKREYAYWLDQSGNNNDWTSNNLTESDISVDSPTNNFATMNPNNPIFTGKTLSEGNLKVSGSTINQVGANGTIYINSSGKWYAEVVMTENAGGQPMIGLNDGTNTLGNRGLIFYNDGRKGQNGGYVTYGSNTSWTTGDIMGIAYNGDDNGGECTFYKNGVSLGVAYTNLNTALGDTFTFTCQNNASGTTSFIWNFGQDSSFAGNKTAQGNQDSNDIGDFFYEPPNGFLALCSSNLPDATVTPSEHFNTVLYTGTGNAQSVTGVGFQPDWVWLKRRSGVQNNNVFDAVRGNTKLLATNTTDAEGTVSQWLNSFDSDGFTVGTAGNVSANGETNVVWNWKANGSGSSNTDGDITSTVSVNTDAGFSIVSYTGNDVNGETVGHGLSKAPELVIIKARGGSYTSQGWGVIGSVLSSTTALKLDSTAATVSAAGVTTNTLPTATVFTVADNYNHSGSGHIAYCFHSVDGYSKVGSYTGNGNADGTFIYTGFRPAFVMIKQTNASGESWQIFDSKRDIDNLQHNRLKPDSSAAEATNINVSSENIDSVSNGFKLRGYSNGINQSGGSYIYLAFAETPFKNSNAR